jgi:trehalose-6-phosphatase
MLVSRIEAIFSDYDGTLCPTSTVMKDSGSIPGDLELILRKASEKIPVCIISSKDFHFLQPRTRFAWVLSCMMGIETIKLRTNNATFLSEDQREERWLSLRRNRKVLASNSVLLSGLAGHIERILGTDGVRVERKFTSDGRLLAGVTVDYRHLEDWKISKRRIDPLVKEMVLENKSSSTESANADLYCMTYNSHPFVDIYAVYCDKGIAFDRVASEIVKMRDHSGANINRGVLYLGDSENDNPAFEKASLALGVVSDKRLNPKLDCQYLVEFKELSALLERLVKDDFRFSENLLSRNY